MMDPVGFHVPATHCRVRDFTRDGVRRSVEDSLERMGLDRIDVLYPHDAGEFFDDALREGYPALAELRSEGSSADRRRHVRHGHAVDFGEGSDVDVALQPAATRCSITARPVPWFDPRATDPGSASSFPAVSCPTSNGSEFFVTPWGPPQTGAPSTGVKATSASLQGRRPRLAADLRGLLRAPDPGRVLSGGRRRGLGAVCSECHTPAVTDSLLAREWRASRRTGPRGMGCHLAALPLGTPITGEVIGRQSFGVFVRIDGAPDAVGLAGITSMPRDAPLRAVGATVKGEVTWHAGNLRNFCDNLSLVLN
jgi:hypothetical protein